MKNKKYAAIGIAAVLVLALAIFGYNRYVYHDTYILIDGGEYRRDAASLDLSGKPLTELEKLAELAGLKELNLLDTGITLEQYDVIQASLPGCRITWSVPFQGGYISSAADRIVTTELAESDIALLDYFPNLKEIQAAGCREYELMMALEQDRPDLTVSYTVPAGKAEVSNQAAQLTITGATLADLNKALPLLPRAAQVTLEGDPLSVSDLLELTAGHPEISFCYEFDLLGQRISWDADFLDFTNTKMTDTADLEAALPLLPNLTKVDMVDCGLSNEYMEELNLRNPGVQFVWTVWACNLKIRTDTTYLMPVQFKVKGLGSYSDLKYCHDMVVMDFGHYGIHNVDFVKYMPKLEYLLLHSAYVSDLSAIGSCTSLRFLELMNTPVNDFWPLVNLTNLEDLNIARTPDNGNWEYGAFGDITPLLQMTWLDRIWMAETYPNREGRQLIAEQLPHTITIYHSKGSVNGGWRHSYNYYTHRDIINMSYYV